MNGRPRRAIIRRPRIGGVSSALLILIGLVTLASCGDSTTLPPEDDDGDPGIDFTSWPQSSSVISDLPPACSEPMPVALLAESGQQMGTVEVTHDASMLYVAFRSEASRPITASAVLASDAVDGIPTTSEGEPHLPSFALRSSHPGGPTEVIWEIPRSTVTGPDAAIAAFALVGQLPAWGDGDPISSGHWATFMLHTIDDCGVERVGSEGGTATTTSGAASLTIPAGALTETVDIQLLSALLVDLAEHVPSSEWDATLGTVYDVTPVDGTIWDLRPDGVVFDEPATVVLRYDDSTLPAGFDEELLRVYVINAVFDPRPSIVDAVANTITAEIGHLAYAFLAMPPADEGATVDLTAGQPAIAAGSVVRVGEVMGFTGRVDNLEVETSNEASMLIEISGDIEPGIVPDECAVITPVDPVALAVECPVESLEAFDIDVVGPVWFTPQSEGDVEVVTTVSPAPEDSDTDLTNNVGRLVVEIAETFLVDLEPASTPRITGTREPGDPITYEVRVGNYQPPSNGGTVVYEASGDVTLGTVAEGCVAGPGPAVSVTCDVDPFVGYVNDIQLPGGGREIGWVGPFEVVPQSTGLVTFSATTSPVAGDTDTDPDNDRLETQLAVGATSVDLAVTSLVGPASATVDVPIDLVVSLQNYGPDPSRGVVVALGGFGNIDYIELPDGCALSSGGARCEVDGLAVDGELTLAFRAVPRSTGPIFVTASVGSLHSRDQDPEQDNNSMSWDVNVAPGG